MVDGRFPLAAVAGVGTGHNGGSGVADICPLGTIGGSTFIFSVALLFPAEGFFRDPGLPFF